MRLTPIAALVLAILSGAVLWMAVPVITGRPFNIWGAGAVSAAVLAVIVWWWWRRNRRQREQIESLRDSALW